MTEALVLGAGMVGTATALALQAQGWQVTLLDRRAPGQETSYGNAGIIQTEAAEPYPLPRDLASLARIALGRGNDVRWVARALPAHLAPIWAYFRASAPARHARASETYARLTRGADRDHAPLIAAAGAEALIRREGFRQAYRDPRQLARDAEDAARLERIYGIRSAVMDGAALAAAEPALTAPLAGALHWRDPWTCADPGGLVSAYAALFAARGGRIVLGDATTLAADGTGWQVASDEGTVRAEHAVVALGPWSDRMLAPLGYRIPLLRKRGYHRHYHLARPLNLPLMDVDNAAVLSPMRMGLRIATGAEIAGFEAPPTPVQLARAEAGVRQILDLGAPVEPAPWLGARPCSPDMLPLVGPAPRHRGLWFHFGHGHQGFTLGPTTGRLLAAQMAGAPAEFPALLPARFG